MLEMWPRELTETERAAILDDQIERFAREGWRLLHRTPMTAQLTRPKRMSAVAAILWLLLCGVGLLVYLLIYVSRRDPVVSLVVTDIGKVRGDFSDGDDAWPKLLGDWRCPVCAYPNMEQHGRCVRCARVK